MRARLSEFRSLSRQQQRLFPVAAVLLALSKLLLAVAGLNFADRCLGWLCRAVGRGRGQPSVTTITWAVAAAASQLPGTYDCLDRALAGSGLLTANGYQHRVKLGVDTTAGGFEAHAWVESDGEVLIGTVDDFGRFRELTQHEVAD